MAHLDIECSRDRALLLSGFHVPLVASGDSDIGLLSRGHDVAHIRLDWYTLATTSPPIPLGDFESPAKEGVIADPQPVERADAQ